MASRVRAATWCALALAAGASAGQNIEFPADGETETESGVCKQPGEPTGALRVHSVKVEGRWAGKLDLPLKDGDLLTAKKASDSLNMLREAISRSAPGYFDSVGEMHVITATGDCIRRPDNSVDFIIKPRFVGLSLVRMGDNVLPIARWREPTPYKEVSPIVRKLVPSVGAAFDDVAGTELSAAVNPRLYHKASTAASPTEHDLTAELSATHSIDEEPRSDAAKLAWDWSRRNGRLRGVSLSAFFVGERELLDGRTHDSDSLGVAAGMMFKLKPNTRLYVDAGFGQRDDELSSTATEAATSVDDDQVMMRVLYETIPRPALGFARASLWASDASGYQQLVARAAYAKEFPLRENQNLGVEVTVGAGRSWGDVPQHARFHGGSVQEQFLYDGATSTSMLAAPRGPILRSFGKNATVGGTRFWHVNVDLAVPIPRWSMPLIPHESADIALGDGEEDLTIKQLMLNQVNSGSNFLQPVLVLRGMDPAEAAKQAKDIMAEVQPAAHYVINDANIWSVKPMLMVDVAGLSDGSESETWVSVGAGVQVTVVTAKFEAGYSRTVSGPTLGSRGAPFARLVFQRLF